MTAGAYATIPRSMTLSLISGATISFRSAENHPSLFADNVAAMVIDNAALMVEKSWLALRETLANTSAPARIISTVANRSNWFNEIARRAEADPTPDFVHFRFTALDAIAEGILTVSDLDQARLTLPDHIFRSMYLCEPYDDRVEAAHRAADPRLMTDEELAIIAGFDPAAIASIPDADLERLVQS